MFPIDEENNVHWTWTKTLGIRAIVIIAILTIVFLAWFLVMVDEHGYDEANFQVYKRFHQADYFACGYGKYREWPNGRIEYWNGFYEKWTPERMRTFREGIGEGFQYRYLTRGEICLGHNNSIIGPVDGSK